MLRMFSYVLTTVALTVLMTVAVAAAGVQWTSGPTVTQSNGVVSASGTVTGLAAGKVTVILAAEGPGKIQCINPGGHVNPAHSGIRRHIVRTTRSTTQTNGTLTFTVSTPSSPILSDRQHLCPNANWTAKLQAISLKRAVLAIVQHHQVLYKHTFPLNQ